MCSVALNDSIFLFFGSPTQLYWNLGLILAAKGHCIKSKFIDTKFKSVD